MRKRATKELPLQAEPGYCCHGQGRWRRKCCVPDHKIRYNHLVVGLNKDLVVLAERHQEHDGSDVLETVDPLPPLRTLAAHVHHPTATAAINHRRLYALHEQSSRTALLEFCSKDLNKQAKL